ncbi:hypothetical protein IQ241_09075 [Romeria aff. gracilis LEGE 07310]|uniref:SWIM-type domain-containing protein n=1 Tax=Vasconcelosia minhoensis LEGE 07310 TaxID=915328 RepID=A0A8J7A6A1_9CYAN|nr:DUF6880 family protein [Romeria gracilis]MBE9077447.1 hypothetical protein [Romeria aff. gracilis LEGE 07310]
MATFSDILDEDLLMDLAGDRYYERGVGYFERGRVHSLAQYDERITAEVHGTEVYQVRLWLEDNELASRCSCPLGVEGAFCKHCVAVGLTWIAEPPLYRPDVAAPARVGITMEDVHDYLAQQERDTLVRMILNQAMEDTRWREYLLMKAAANRAGGVDIGTFRRALRSAIAVDGYVDYYAADGYAEGVETAIYGLEDLLNAGYDSDVVTLSEEAIALLEDAFNAVDDSSGGLSLVADQVQDLHYRACEAAQPDPQALAERLFHMELNSGFGFFHNALETYADILGEAGQDAYRELVDTEWKKLPEVVQPGDHSFSYRRSQLSRMKEALVSATGDLEELVAVIAQDLSQPSRYQRIAEIYQEAGQTDAAIDWAEQGVDAFDAFRTGQLSDFLISAYEQQGRFNDAVNLVWEAFSRRPSLQLYQKLKRQADKAQRWPDWRDRALDRARLASAGQQPNGPRFQPLQNSLLVEIFLWEGDLDQAWKAAKSGGCSRNLWMQLAEARAAEHPEDALSVYRPAIEPLIDQTHNDAYRQAVDLIVKVEDLMKKLDRKAEFEQFLAELSTTYKRKRNFIKLLNHRGLLR